MTAVTRKSPPPSKGRARANPGPAAGPRNRAALLAAARTVFAERGIAAPLSEVARRAGVGQGSLYRHFPDRVALAVAVFEDNVAELEALAADPRADLDALIALLTRQIVDSTAFVELVRRHGDDDRVAELANRTAAALRGRLDVDGVGGRLRGPGDFQLAVTMVAGAITSAPEGERAAVAAHAWRLLGLDVGQ